MVYVIEKVVFDVVIVCFCVRGDVDIEVVIFVDEVVCLLSFDRYVGFIEIL